MKPLDQTLSDVIDEIIVARKKFPGSKHMLAALMEEVGELAQAFLQGQQWDSVYAEAKQVACIAIRMMEEGDMTFSTTRPPVQKGLQTMNSFSDNGKSEITLESLVERTKADARSKGYVEGVHQTLSVVKEILRNNVYITGFAAGKPGFDASCCVDMNASGADLLDVIFGHNTLCIKPQRSKMLTGKAEDVIIEAATILLRVP
jgi:hypothetical protein